MQLLAHIYIPKPHKETNWLCIVHNKNTFFLLLVITDACKGFLMFKAFQKYDNTMKGHFHDMGPLITSVIKVEV